MNDPSETSNMTRIRIAIAIVETDGKFLVRQRPDGAPLAWFWEFPGGKVRDGETPLEAARRELFEETGLSQSLAEAPDVVDFDYPHGKLRLSFFRCRLPKTAENPADVAGWMWVDRAKLAELSFPEANRSIVARLVDEETRS